MTDTPKLIEESCLMDDRIDRHLNSLAFTLRVVSIGCLVVIMSLVTICAGAIAIRSENNEKRIQSLENKLNKLEKPKQ